MTIITKDGSLPISQFRSEVDLETKVLTRLREFVIYFGSATKAIHCFLLLDSRMSSKPEGSLSNSAIKDKQVKLTSSYTVIQTYVQIILEQPDITLDALPDLPKHQANARQHASNWNNNILPLLSKTNADIIDYSNQFTSFYEQLVKFANDIKNPESRKNLLQGLKLLSSTITQKDKNVQHVNNQLSTFQANLNKDDANFAKDANTAAVKIVGDSGEIKALSKQLDAIQDAMDKDIGLMAGGAVTIVAGIAMVVFGAVSEIPSGGASTALIGGGVLVANGGVIMETLGATDYNNLIKKQKEVTEQLAEDKQQLAALKTTKKQVSGFVKGLENAITAASALRAGWQALHADLQEVITAVDNVDPNVGSWLVAELERAKKDWEVALDQAKRLQPDGKVPTKLYENLQDAFKEMKPLLGA